MSYPFGNDPAKVEGYRRLWARAPVERPLIGFSLKSWFPIYEFRASRAWIGADYLTVDMIHPEEFIEEQEQLLREGETMDDDIVRGACPSQAVQWLGPMLGTRLRILPESTLDEDLELSWDEIEAIALERENPWFLKYPSSSRPWSTRPPAAIRSAMPRCSGHPIWRPF